MRRNRSGGSNLRDLVPLLVSRDSAEANRQIIRSITLYGTET